MARGYRTVEVQLASSTLVLRGSEQLLNAMETITQDMNLYQGVRFAQILEAVYAQGKKDGAREAFESVTIGLEQAKSAIPHKNPGRPRKDKLTQSYSLEE